jgi:hypothetical protein
MAHYAFLDENNIVVDVISGKDELEDGIDWEVFYCEFRGQVCKRTSFNTIAGKHENGKTPFRKNYAGVGFFYDSVRDAFIPPKPYPSWILNDDTCLWESPKPCPGNRAYFVWDESSQEWVNVESNS